MGSHNSQKGRAVAKKRATSLLSEYRREVNIAVMARSANLLGLTLVSLTAFSLVLAEEYFQASEVEGEEAELPEESFTSTKEFKAIMGGVAGFWGGVFALGAVYLFAVFAKRMYNPEEAVVKGED